MISKTDIQSFLQCPRRLWLEHNPPASQEPPDSQTDRRAREGDAVGAQARTALGTDIIWPLSDADKATACAAALEQLAARPGSPAVEVPLVAGDVYARTDALIPVAPGRYILQETKASSFPLKDDKVTPAKPEAHHLDDVAIQAWGMAQTALKMDRAELNLLDGQWRYPGGGNYAGLFKTMDVTDQVLVRMAEVGKWAAGARDVLAGEALPAATTGAQCKKPHDCPFKATCHSLEPEPLPHPISLLPDVGGKALAKKLALAGHTSLVTTPADQLVGTDPARTALYQRMQKAHASGSFVLRPEARAAIDNLAYPRTYFDFEGIDLAIPVWPGVRPFEQICFQFSCHVQRQPGGEFEHTSFLDLTGFDPSLACIEAMRRAIPEGAGPILVYFATYERCRIRELAERHPQHAKLLEGFLGRLVDLLPIVKENFYDPVMEGSFSIKKVLKAVAPTLDYAKLEGVQEGTGAQLAYLEAAFDANTSEARKAEIAKQLTVYCRQDTWAMVLIAYFLARRSAPAIPLVEETDDPIGLQRWTAASAGCESNALPTYLDAGAGAPTTSRHHDAAAR